MKNTTENDAFIKLRKPHIALITNHGYGGVNIPIGGAPDTGGQNVYVNSYARALDKLGYKITIYARGGFPFYKSGKIREGHEFLTPNVRYLYVPGGGDNFIRKEDISAALIEELEWIYEQINHEAKMVGVLPWRYYDMVNTHYWDAGVIAVSLVVKWQNDLTSSMIRLLTQGVVSDEDFARFHERRHFNSISKAPEVSLGQVLLESIEGSKYIHEEEAMMHAFENWAKRSPLAAQLEGYLGKDIDWMNLRSTVAAATIELRPIVLAKVLGAAVFDQPIMNTIYEDPCFHKYRSFKELESFGDLFHNSKRLVNKHVWTPHSLGVIKEWNFRNKPIEVIRDLKFRERRSHERMICDYTRAFGATSFEIAKSLIANYGVSIEEVLFYPPGVDINIFHDYSNGDIKELKDFLEKEIGVPRERLENDLVILEASRMDMTKRKDVVLKAFGEVIRRGNSDSILLIGGGPQNETFRTLQAMIDSDPVLQGRAFLLGFVPEHFLPMLFSYCDIYMSASEMEGFGMSVAQAAIDGKPIISSDKIPFSTFYLADDAIILEAGDVKGFADGLEQLLNAPEERKARGAKSKQNALKLEWERLTCKFILDLNKLEFDIPITDRLAKNM